MGARASGSSTTADLASLGPDRPRSSTTADLASLGPDRPRSILATCLVLLSCASSAPPVEPAPAAAGPPPKPDWLVEGGQVYAREGGKVIRAAGSSTGVRNRALACTTAMNRGRAEVARTLEAMIAAALKCYGCEYEVEVAPAEEEARVTRAQAERAFTARVLSYSVPIATFDDAAGGLHALLELDVPRALRKIAAEAKDPEVSMEKMSKLLAPQEPLEPPPPVNAVDDCGRVGR